MKNIIDYVQGERSTFAEKPLNGVDSLILSTVSYYQFDDLVPGPGSLQKVHFRTLLQSNAGTIVPQHHDSKDRQDLAEALMQSPRFCDLYVTGYVNQLDETMQKQFSAVTFLLPDDTAYVAFRGTDNTVVGWKEDFNMTYVYPVPAQQESVKYLNAMASQLPNALRVGGHSKGGNLAVYAAMACDDAYRHRIEQVYNHDGPGFRQEVIQSDGYKAVEPRIRLYVPQSSVVGLLLYQKGDYSVVESNKFWILQHDPFSWEIENDDFHYAEQLSHSAMHLNERLDEWLSSFTDEQRALFIDSIYRIIQATNVETVSEFSANWRNNAIEALNATMEIDEQTRKFLRQTIGALFFNSVKRKQRMQARLDRAKDALENAKIKATELWDKVVD